MNTSPNSFPLCLTSFFVLSFSELYCLKIIADDVIDIKRVRDKLSRHINVKLSYDKASKEILSQVHSIAKSSKGHCRFILNIESSNGYMQRVVSNDLNVSPSLEFIQKLRDILGHENVWIDS